MGCGCKSKKPISDSSENVISEGKSSSFNWGGILKATGLTIIVTLAFPILWVIVIVNLFKNYVNDSAVDIGGLINAFSKKGKVNNATDEDDVEINPDDLELVGVEKIA